MSKSTNNKFIFLILISLCFLVYFNTLDNEFVSDDIDAITKSTTIMHPLQNWYNFSSFAESLIYKVAKLHPWPYHLFNIV